MQLIDEIEISYFRSFYKFKLRDLQNLNVIFGKNDSGKSNVVRALSLFFSGEMDNGIPFDFETDFCDQRLQESLASEDVRKFLYVKVTFNTPKSYQRSLGKQFYVKRQWTVSRGANYIEEFSASIPSNKRHIATRFLNKIRFIYIPAIKDISIFEMLLTNIYDTLANNVAFQTAVDAFTGEVQNLTSSMFETLPREVSESTKIGPPTQMHELFETLDFETISAGDSNARSLTNQRGDGVKARHIPELLAYISQHDDYEYHIWGFEEPENSLDFTASQSEAERFLSLSNDEKIQVFMTTHSPSFYLLDDAGLGRFYVRKGERNLSEVLQGREIKAFDAKTAMEEGFYLPAIAEALEGVAEVEKRALAAEKNALQLQEELKLIATPVVLTEGKTDAMILTTAWNKLRDDEIPFRIRSCETGVENAGSGNGGASSLATCLKGVASDHPHKVIGIFDFDDEGEKAFRLNRNFVDRQFDGVEYKASMHGSSFAFLLPAPDFRDDCARYKNLPIEFLFKDADISKQVEGKGLVLEVKCASTKVGNEVIRLPLGDLTHFKDVKAEKTFFAEVVVPTLGAEAFEGFENVFQVIEAIIADPN